MNDRTNVMLDTFHRDEQVAKEEVRLVEAKCSQVIGRVDPTMSTRLILVPPILL